MKQKKQTIEKKVNKKRLQGVVVSDKMEKTVVVEVQRLIAHPIYKKRFLVSKKYKAHDENNQYKTGDKVIIEETRPLAKTKHWQVVK